MILIGPLSVETAGIPVDAADLQYQRFVGQHGMKAVVELLPQRTGGGQQVGLVLLFMLLKPAAVVIEADAPEKIHRLLVIALKHHHILAFLTEGAAGATAPAVVLYRR